MAFLPVSRQDMDERGFERCDFIYISGDAYVDHPTFGAAIITRVLEREGYRVGVIAQPDFRSARDISRLGEPRLGFLISSGNIDSMVAHYTAAKRKRSSDMYSPGGKAGKRPDRALEVYTRLVREAYPKSFVAIGGVEASLRRFAHYDYWSDSVLPSILVSSGADILLYGMGERSILELAGALNSGEHYKLRQIKGACYLAEAGEKLPGGSVSVPSFEKVKANKNDYLRAHKMEHLEQDSVTGRAVIQKHGGGFLVQNPPGAPLSQSELDGIFALPYERYYHPSYEAAGGVPAIEEVEFSLWRVRGCFGGCNFCSIAFHQGRRVVARSDESVMAEARLLTKGKRFKGYIHDVGGPTANFSAPSCGKQIKEGHCRDRQCLAPNPCNELNVSHERYLALLRELRALPRVKKVFIRSGIRFDYLMRDKNREFFYELVGHHVSGQLKVAPEHCSKNVLRLMGKPDISVYERFEREFYKINNELGLEQYLVPYLMSSHPGSRLSDAVELALFLKRHRVRPEQVQDFYPTPGSTSTCMYYTGRDPNSGGEVYVPKTGEEKAMQRALLQYFKPENKALVIKALRLSGRQDLIGRGESCLVAPGYGANAGEGAAAKGRSVGRALSGKKATDESANRGKNTRGGAGKVGAKAHSTKSPGTNAHGTNAPRAKIERGKNR